MRTIKFRAWDTKDKRFLPIIEGHEYTFRQYEDELSLEYECTLEENVVLMQFTGLLDKNGKEIYEGDVVKGYSESEFGSLGDVIGEVFYYEKVSAFQIKMGELHADIAENIEVIGNIYQNPNLITP